MEKAYDIKDLGKKLAASGVPMLKDVAEEEAKVIYSCLKAWLQESAVLSPNKVDDVVVPFLSYMDSIVLKEIDKIDGKTGE